MKKIYERMEEAVWDRLVGSLDVYCEYKLLVFEHGMLMLVISSNYDDEAPYLLTRSNFSLSELVKVFREEALIKLGIASPEEIKNTKQEEAYRESRELKERNYQTFRRLARDFEGRSLPYWLSSFEARNNYTPPGEDPDVDQR